MLNRSFPIVFALLLVVAVGCDDDDETTAPLAETFAAVLTGDDEVPPVQTNASGLATFTVRGSTVDFTIVVENIQNANAAHIHSGEAGVNGAVLVPLFSGSFSGSDTLVTGSFSAATIVGDSVSYTELVSRLDDGSLYTNVHTDANAPGEIRGQIEGPVTP